MARRTILTTRRDVHPEDQSLGKIQQIAFIFDSLSYLFTGLLVSFQKMVNPKMKQTTQSQVQTSLRRNPPQTSHLQLPQHHTSSGHTQPRMSSTQQSLMMIQWPHSLPLKVILLLIYIPSFIIKRTPTIYMITLQSTMIATAPRTKMQFQPRRTKSRRRQSRSNWRQRPGLMAWRLKRCNLS